MALKITLEDIKDKAIDLAQSGVAMFVEQARAAFALWTGVPMPAESAYAAVRRALAERG